MSPSRTGTTETIQLAMAQIDDKKTLDVSGDWRKGEKGDYGVYEVGENGASITVVNLGRDAETGKCQTRAIFPKLLTDVVDNALTSARKK